MIAVSTGFSDGGTRGILIDESKPQALPFIFNDVSEAQAFLDSAERAGANVWPGMPLNDLQSLVRLWRDASKRSGEPVVANESIPRVPR